MADDPSIREISVEFARTIAHELCVEESYFDIQVYGPDPHEHSVCIEAISQAAEDMIERYIRRAIEKDRKARTAA